MDVTLRLRVRVGRARVVVGLSPITPWPCVWDRRWRRKGPIFFKKKKLIFSRPKQKATPGLATPVPNSAKARSAGALARAWYRRGVPGNPMLNRPAAPRRRLVAGGRGPRQGPRR